MVALTKILTLSWPDYLQALRVQCASRQLYWPNAVISLDERTDQSWINALARFRAETRDKLAELREDERELLVGHLEAGTNTYFFGNLQAAGTVTSLIREPESFRPAATVTAVDAARKEARSLGRKPTVKDVLAPWCAISDLHHFGPAAASRLLLAERPDLYFMLNSASREKLQTLTGHQLPQLLVMPALRQHYGAMLDAVYESPWWRSLRPRDPYEGFIWDCRAALLDMFVYEPVD